MLEIIYTGTIFQNNQLVHSTKNELDIKSFLNSLNDLRNINNDKPILLTYIITGNKYLFEIEEFLENKIKEDKINNNNKLDENEKWVINYSLTFIYFLIRRFLNDFHTTKNGVVILMNPNGSFIVIEPKQAIQNELYIWDNKFHIDSIINMY